jgi:uncharacterized membrane protein YgdD (TMEM256/DUF423 family)
MDRIFVALGAASALVGVALGAFAAHLLKDRLPADLLTIFEVGVRYQMYHALALLFTGWAAARFASPLIIWGGWLFAAGTILFSGSLYLLALSGVRLWGAVTPVGGLLFLAGWAALAAGALKS